METLIHDVRYGLRMLRKSPAFTAVAIAALALGIASTTAIFSVVDVVLLHPLPYPDSGRIVLISQTVRSTGQDMGDSSPANYLDWAEQNHVFSHIAASRGMQGNLTGGERPERIRYTVASGDFFSLFGVGPQLGRSLLPDDEKPGNDHVTVLSYALWKRLGADPSLVGRNIALNGEPYTAIGVMPASFAPDDYGELWVPSPWDVPAHPLNPQADPRALRDSSYIDVWGRLKPGVTLDQARAEMAAIARRLEKQYPNANDDVGISLVSMQDSLVSDIRPVLWVLLGAVGCVLLIGCANVANLLLARATTRTREISIRTALGASWLRLARQMLTESILLALCGGLLGILLAWWAVPALLTMSPPEISNFKHIGLNPEVLGFSLAISLLSGILFGLAPAFHASQSNLDESLKEGERGSTGGRGRTRSALVVTEVGLSLVLLIGAGLMLKSFVRLMNVDPGFDPNHLLVFSVGLPPSASSAQQDAFYREVVERLQALPGVQSVGAVSRLPLVGGNSSRSFNLPGSTKSYTADLRVSTPGYFRTMGIPLRAGRNLTEQDAQASAQVAVVNEALARNVFPGEDAVGKYIVNFGPLNNKIQIVGIVGNVRHIGLETTPRPEVYLPFGQAHWPSVFVAVRCNTSHPLALTSAVQNVVWSVDKDVPLANLRTMQGVIASSVMRRRFTTLLLAIFSALALLLAAVGLYGVMSYTVSQRTREVGIRMALGARRSDVMKLVVGQGMALVGVGLGLGLLASIALRRVMSGLLFGVSATDPLVFSAFAVLMAIVALLANCLPARRAARVDPMVALRYE